MAVHLDSAAVHGSGCWFTLRDRSEVDVDITLRGEPKFDAWRARSYARSVGVTVDLDVIGQALEELADAGALTRHGHAGSSLPGRTQASDLSR